MGGNIRRIGSESGLSGVDDWVFFQIVSDSPSFVFSRLNRILPRTQLWKLFIMYPLVCS